MSFLTDLTRFQKKTIDTTVEVHRKTVLEMKSRVTARTPIDTGLARSRWQLEGTPGGVMIIFNNLSYIVPLENGHSQQAPFGMATITVAEFPGIVNASVRITRQGTGRA